MDIKKAQSTISFLELFVAALFHRCWAPVFVSLSLKTDYGCPNDENQKSFSRVICCAAVLHLRQGYGKMQGITEDHGGSGPY